MKKKIKNLITYFKITRILCYFLLPQYKKFLIFKKLNLNKNSIFLDIGANEGIVSQYIDDLYSCKIYLYEPHPGCSQILRKKFKHKKNIMINEIAISSKSGYAKLFMHKDSKNEYDIKNAQGTSLEEEKDNINNNHFKNVKILNIEELINKFNYIDVIKIDVETHEYEIIPGIFNNLNKIGKIYCEMNGKNRYTYLKDKYDYWKKKLIKEKVYGTKFIEWT